MPELPEVETLRRDLEARFVGHRLTSVSVTGRRTIRRHGPELLERIVGARLEAVARKGKYLLLEWEVGETLAVHLRMSGQLLLDPSAGVLRPHTHAVLSFDHGGLHFVDPRTFGEMFLLGRDHGLGHLGPDALLIDPAVLAERLGGRRAPLKSLLVDQRVVAGIGNIYADEICFEAGLRPDLPAYRLETAELGRLAEAMSAVLRAAVEARGSSLADRQYRDLGGELGTFQMQHRVYARAGLPCARCSQPLEQVDFGARRAVACRRCQV